MVEPFLVTYSVSSLTSTTTSLSVPFSTTVSFLASASTFVITPISSSAKTEPTTTTIATPRVASVRNNPRRFSIRETSSKETTPRTARPSRLPDRGAIRIAESYSRRLLMVRRSEPPSTTKFGRLRWRFDVRRLTLTVRSSVMRFAAGRTARVLSLHFVVADCGLVAERRDPRRREGRGAVERLGRLRRRRPLGRARIRSTRPKRSAVSPGTRPGTARSASPGVRGSIPRRRVGTRRRSSERRSRRRSTARAARHSGSPGRIPDDAFP